MSDLFPDEARFVRPLPQDELRLLAVLPDLGDNDCVAEVAQEDEGACRRLAKRGLVKIHRWKDDPIADRPTMYAGRVGVVR